MWANVAPANPLSHGVDEPCIYIDEWKESNRVLHSGPSPAASLWKQAPFDQPTVRR